MKIPCCLYSRYFPIFMEHTYCLIIFVSSPVLGSRYLFPPASAPLKKCPAPRNRFYKFLLTAPASNSHKKSQLRLPLNSFNGSSFGSLYFYLKAQLRLPNTGKYSITYYITFSSHTHNLIFKLDTFFS